MQDEILQHLQGDTLHLMRGEILQCQLELAGPLGHCLLVRQRCGRMGEMGLRRVNTDLCKLLNSLRHLLTLRRRAVAPVDIGWR